MSQKILYLTSDVPISVNAYLKARAFIMIIKGKQVAQVTMYESKEAKEYKKKFITYVKNEIIKQQWSYEEGKFVIVKAVIYFDRSNRDANNIWKIMIDALVDSGVFPNDTMVMERVERIYYDTVNPRVELKILHSKFVGIFDDEKEYQRFVIICKGCSRYKNNCSILSKCLESRIVGEISINDKDIKVCSKFKAIRTK